MANERPAEGAVRLEHDCTSLLLEPGSRLTVHRHLGGNPTVRIRTMMLWWLGTSRAGWRGQCNRAGALTVMLVLMSACTDQQPTEPSRQPGPVRQSETSTGVFRDDFADADSTLLEDHTPDGGGLPIPR